MIADEKICWVTGLACRNAGDMPDDNWEFPSSGDVDAGFLRHARIEHWRPGDIVKVYEPGTGIYFILKGAVNIVGLYAATPGSIVYRISENNFFFDCGYFQELDGDTVVYAREEAMTGYLPARKVDLLLASSIDFCHALILSMVKKNREFRNRRPGCNCPDPETHMLNVLYALASIDTGQPEEVLCITQEQLAAYVGKHPVNTNITLKRLEKRDLIKPGRGRIALNLEKVVAALVG